MVGLGIVDCDIAGRIDVIGSDVEGNQVAFLQSAVVVTLDQYGLLCALVHIDSVGSIGVVVDFYSAILRRNNAINSITGCTRGLVGQCHIGRHDLATVAVHHVGIVAVLSQINVIQIPNVVGIEITHCGRLSITRNGGLVDKEDTVRSDYRSVKGLGIFVVQVSFCRVSLLCFSNGSNLNLAVGNVRILDNRAGLQLCSVLGVLMNLNCGLCAICFHHFDFQGIKRVADGAIRIFHHSVLRCLSYHLCRIGNSVNQIQLNGFSNLVCRCRLQEIRVDRLVLGNVVQIRIIRCSIDCDLLHAVITGQLTLYGFCLGYSGISIGSGCRGVIQCGNKNNVVLCNILIDVVVLDLNAADAVVERNLFVVYRSNPSQLRLNHVGSGDISILVADKLNGVSRNSLQVAESGSDIIGRGTTGSTYG